MSADFVSGPVTVRVPATSANLGPGFDSFGLAWSIHDEVTAEVRPSGLEISADGEGAESVPTDESHLIVATMRATFDRLGATVPGLRLHGVNRIPHGRGLGSSAAAIVAGVLLARALVDGGADRLDSDACLALASEIEGHPDNVAACLLGGLTVAWTEDGVGRAVRIDPRLDAVTPVLFIPTDSSSTHTARAALPTSVPHVDAVFNVSRAALLVAAFDGRPELLFTATEDRLHQPYRADSMPGSSGLVATVRAAGIAAAVSGAGSTVLALPVTPEQTRAAVGLTPAGWRNVLPTIADGAATVG